MTLDRELQVVGRDARTIIRHHDADQAPALDRDVDPARAGVERVLDQLLER